MCSYAADVDVSLRPVAAGDRPFLRAVFASTKGPELALLAHGDDLHERFLGAQFVRFERALASESTADFVIVADGRDVGRLAISIEANGGRLHIVDIAVVTRERNRGVGTAVIEKVVALAMADNREVTLHVDKGSPARRLYERLGFVLDEAVDNLQLRYVLRAAAE